MTALPPRPTHDFKPLRFCVPVPLSAEARRQQIATLAYFKAAARGFAPGHEQEDWLAAESEVNAQMNQAFILV